MKPRIRITLEVDTLEHAQTIANAITNRIEGKDIFENHGITSFFENISGKNFVVSELRFNGRINRDDVFEWLKDQVQNHPQIKNWINSAKLVTHLCSHDDNEIKDCSTSDYIEWIK